MPDYSSKKTRHTPRVFIKRGGDVAIHLNGEPACGKDGGPGSTTVVDVYVSCEACLAILAGKP